MEIAKLRDEVAAMKKSFVQMSEISMSNFRIMGRMLASLEVLRKKGLFTDEETKQEFLDIEKANNERAKVALEAERARIVAEKEAKRDKDSGNPETGGVQPEETGSNEGGVGSSGLKVL